MRILFILPQIPWPPESGGRIVTSNTVRRFAQSNDVFVVCLYHHPDELKHLDTVKSWCREVAAFPAHAKWDFLTLLRSCFSRHPYKALRFLNADMAGYVSRLIQRERIEIVHAQNFYTTAYITGQEPCLRIHYKENIEGLLLERYADSLNHPLLTPLARRESRRTLRYERQGARKFHRVLSISPLDTARLQEMEPDLSVSYQRAGVDLERYPLLEGREETASKSTNALSFSPPRLGETQRGLNLPEQSTPPNALPNLGEGNGQRLSPKIGGDTEGVELECPPTVLFTGTMSYHPNYNGILRFLRDGWPRVRSAVQDARLLVVGHAPPEKLRAWDGKHGVTVTGSVPEIGPYFREAHVFLVPLWVAGGIRLKILEAMASGRAVVSTPIGCEGLEVENGSHLLVAEDPADLAEHVVHLLTNRELRTQLVRQARHRIEEQYDWDVVIRDQESRYREWLDQWKSAVNPGSPMRD